MSILTSWSSRPLSELCTKAEFICAVSMHWTLPSRARRHRQRHSKPANVASFTLRVSLRPEAMKATLSIEATTSANRWLHLWSTPDLATRTTIEWSPRLTRSLGRCYPERRLIRLAAFLEESENALLEEVLCHELAHLAARELHGRHIRPHGSEWKALMRAAGFEPKTRLPAPEAVPVRMYAHLSP